MCGCIYSHQSIIIWIIVVVIVDPFNYFNISKSISLESKIESAKKLNSLLYNLIEFKNNPQPNIIIEIQELENFQLIELKKLLVLIYITC